tara:strand:+ start:211 stop:513 length:303 start_codon:yes stop_codon:yes gene_type:complete
VSEWTNIEFTFVITKKRIDGLNEYKIVAFDNSDNEYSQDEAQEILEESCKTVGRWKVLTPAKNIADATYIIDAMIDIDEMIYDEFGPGEGPTFDPPTFTN